MGGRSDDLPPRRLFRIQDSSPLTEQTLLAGLTPDEIADLTALATPRSFHTGERIIAAGDPASSLFFLLSGMVSVKLPSGVRLATLRTAWSSAKWR